MVIMMATTCEKCRKPLVSGKCKNLECIIGLTNVDTKGEILLQTQLAELKAKMEAKTEPEAVEAAPKK